jgi:hypothetical protein
MPEECRGLMMKEYLHGDRFTIHLPNVTKGVDKELTRVVFTSPVAHRRIIERFGYYFKREFQYDFPPFETDVIRRYQAWIFASKERDPDWRPFGACEFVPNNPTNAQYWVLAWIWFHPYFRGNGYLKRAWPIFVADLGGPIEVSQPISRAMLGFLRVVDPKTLGPSTTALLERIAQAGEGGSQEVNISSAAD